MRSHVVVGEPTQHRVGSASNVRANPRLLASRDLIPGCDTTFRLVVVPRPHCRLDDRGVSEADATRAVTTGKANNVSAAFDWIANNPARTNNSPAGPRPQQGPSNRSGGDADLEAALAASLSSLTDENNHKTSAPMGSSGSGGGGGGGFSKEDEALSRAIAESMSQATLG